MPFWADGHKTGIYTYDYLRKNCECADCLAARDAAQSNPARPAPCKPAPPTRRRPLSQAFPSSRAGQGTEG